MSKQLLVPVSGIEDAKSAIRSLPQVCAPGDEVIILAISEEPEEELIGGQPNPIVSTGPYTGPAGSAGTRSPDDIPVFLEREELMEMRGRELCEALANLSQPLRDSGINARVDAAFSDHPSEAILEYAGNIEPQQILVTEKFRKTLDHDNEEFATVLPGT